MEEGALALIARAAEGSVRDALSLLDQAIAHDEGGTITADACATCWAWPTAAGCWTCSRRLMGGDDSRGAGRSGRAL